jgi:hypothetical protein
MSDFSERMKVKYTPKYLKVRVTSIAILIAGMTIGFKGHEVAEAYFTNPSTQVIQVQPEHRAKTQEEAEAENVRSRQIVFNEIDAEAKFREAQVAARRAGFTQ